VKSKKGKSSYILDKDFSDKDAENKEGKVM
jgi:hypothetical protein